MKTLHDIIEEREREFLREMPDYIKARWGVNEEKIIFNAIRQTIISIFEVVKKGIENRVKELDGNGGALGTPTIHVIAELSNQISYLQAEIDDIKR